MANQEVKDNDIEINVKQLEIKDWGTFKPKF